MSAILHIDEVKTIIDQPAMLQNPNYKRAIANAHFSDNADFVLDLLG
jgi:hypothetical protein